MAKDENIKKGLMGFKDWFPKNPNVLNKWTYYGIYDWAPFNPIAQFIIDLHQNHPVDSKHLDKKREK